MLSTIKQFIYRPIGIYHTYCRARKRNNILHNRIYLLNIPSHGNLGDHLLSIAEQQFFADNFPDREIVLVSSADLYYSIRFALMDVREDDVLCVTGGGFMGSLYEEEERFLTIIKRFPTNKIVFFPQTIYYEASPKGEALIQKAAKVYSGHKHLYVMARDSKSYDLLVNRLMPNSKHRVFLTPDIALYVHAPQGNKRNGVMWCLRQDGEIDAGNDAIVKAIKEIFEARALSQHQTDTYVYRSISIENEHHEVKAKMNEISKAQLVITDRLHGMIYSLITDTPVIALDNLSKKVSQVYNLWLKEILFVKVVDDTTDLEKIIDSMLQQTACHYNNIEIRKKYQPIIDAINE
ncbi:MAG: polysaccharide pyruvyl transferase family protein [Bacteroidales bacterium]|nr:polysaccharide pyruvyl transferase family protein [Candidatus Equimonas faecalis]